MREIINEKQSKGGERGGMTARGENERKTELTNSWGLHHTLAQTSASEHECSPLKWKEKP